jgi:hypothetical protein
VIEDFRTAAGNDPTQLRAAKIYMPLRIDGAPRRLLVKLLTIRYGKVILRIGLGYCK